VGGTELETTRALTRNMSPFNLLGFPALTVPCGFDSQELPIGLQIAGRPFEEDLILRIGHAYQQVTDWHKWRPPGDTTA
jgi:aspartyl-tRNA(Asn)/glutamyl-tRNA(Gln) amidotransferase subunit A